VALVAINNQQPMYTYSAILCILVEMMQLGNTKLICHPAIIAYCYDRTW
jgi:hypothetical protein